MRNEIKNAYIKVAVNNFGAQLCSFKTADDVEHLWQSSNVWKDQAPILFPIVGRLLNDTYIVDGKQYHMRKHGFARESEFELINKTDENMIFSLKSNSETLKIYPYNFELLVKFTLQDAVLLTTYSVLNNGNEDMYFSIGAHPGFKCNIGDYLEFEHNETLEREYVDTEGIIIPEKKLVLDNDNKIVITEDIFERDALLLSGFKSTSICLKSGAKTLKMTLGDAPYLGIWAVPSANYVCIEPWFGINDSYEHNYEFSQKRGINKLSKNSRFDFSHCITVLNTPYTNSRMT